MDIEPLTELKDRPIPDEYENHYARESIIANVDVSESFLPLWEDNFEHCGLHGGRGGGKSHAVAEWIVAVSSLQNERVVCGRQFQNSIKDSVKELMEQKIKKLGLVDMWKTTETELVNIVTGSRMTFIGMDRNPDSAKSLEGATIFWGEEAQTFTKRSIEIIIPTIRDPRSRMIWTWNPRFRTDEVDVMFRGGHPPEKSIVIEVSYLDNPYFYQTRMPSEFRRSARATPKRHGHIWLGEYDENPDAAIFPNHSSGRIDVPEKVFPRFGMDFGFGSDPNFLVKLYVIEPEDLGLEEDDLGVIYFAQEAVGHHVPNSKIPDLISEIVGIKDATVIADSARPETIDYLNSKGLNFYGSKKGAGSVKNGINFLLGYHLLVDPDCPNLLSEIKNYKWKLDPSDKPLPMPEEKQQDHGIDAARYAVEELSLYGEDDDEDGDVVYI